MMFRPRFHYQLFEKHKRCLDSLMLILDHQVASIFPELFFRALTFLLALPLGTVTDALK